MAEAATTTRPARKRATPAAKAAAPAAKAAAAPAEAKSGATTEDGTTRVAFPLTALEPTKRYAKFEPPADSGCVGALYVPLGTTEVRVLLVGPAA